MTGCYDIRDAFKIEQDEHTARVSLLFTCFGTGGYSMTIEKQVTVLADGSDIKNEAEYHIRLLKDYHNLSAVYKGMVPK